MSNSEANKLPDKCDQVGAKSGPVSSAEDVQYSIDFNTKSQACNGSSTGFLALKPELQFHAWLSLYRYNTRVI